MLENSYYANLSTAYRVIFVGGNFPSFSLRGIYECESYPCFTHTTLRYKYLIAYLGVVGSGKPVFDSHDHFQLPVELIVEFCSLIGGQYPWNSHSHEYL